jgi:hypothetical protein
MLIQRTSRRKNHVTGVSDLKIRGTKTQTLSPPLKKESDSDQLKTVFAATLTALLIRCGMEINGEHFDFRKSLFLLFSFFVIQSGIC